MNMKYKEKRGISWRILLLLIAIIAMLGYWGVKVWTQHVQLNKLRDDGWYIITVCDYNRYDAYVMIDADNEQEVYQDAQLYVSEIINHSEIKELIETAGNGWSASLVEIYFLFPNDEIKFGEKNQCHHGLYINEMCNLCREKAVAKITLDPKTALDEQPLKIIEVSQ